MTQLYLHTVPVRLAGVGKRGAVFEDKAGGFYLVVPGASCVGVVPRSGAADCLCGWEGLIFKCGGSCNMDFGLGGSRI